MTVGTVPGAFTQSGIVRIARLPPFEVEASCPRQALCQAPAYRQVRRQR